MRIEGLKQMDLRFLKGVGEKRAQCFARLGVHTAYDLLFHYPRAYEDWSKQVPIRDAPAGEVCAVRAVLSYPPREHRIRRGMTLYKTEAFDETGTVQITLFNSVYQANKLVQGKEYIFYGKVEGGPFLKTMSSPKFVAASDSAPVYALYPLTEGLTQNIVAKVVDSLLPLVPEDAEDPLPAALREEYGLCPLGVALRAVHRPESMEALGRARRRLAFEELFYLQLGLLLLKTRTRQQTEAKMQPVPLDAYWASLPFSPTGAQRRAVEEACADMQRMTPMNRLLQGDVGSGKTAVAAALCYFCAKNGWQAAMMAPTEILARQHFQTLARTLAPLGISVGLLTGSTPAAERRALLASVEAGETAVLVGTHALLEGKVQFARLGLVITDEQHRFGVEQRGLLAQKGRQPHTLVMSATPIPRTLALMIYGDLDVSVLDELPAGRTPVRTFAVGSGLRERINAFIQKQVEGGHKVYIVCPLVEEHEGNLASAVQYADAVRRRFPRYHVELLHGRMKPAQKDAAMEAFAHGDCSILVSTTVIEVGVDVPEATLMIVENAERFGLGQLHQLRGRVGRGGAESFCILVSDLLRSPETAARLETMTQTTDGFKIAERDLQLRGPGDFFGHRQHGLPLLRIADLCSDMQLLHEAAQAAHAVYDGDETLSDPAHLPLRERVDTLFEQNLTAN